MRVLALDHLVLTVADIEATVAFYQALGMQRVTFSGGRVAMAFGRQKLNLHQAGAEIEPHARHPGPGSADLCFLVDLPPEALSAHLEQQGIAIELGPVPRTGATAPLVSVYVRDPDGNLVELSTEAAA